MKGRIDRFLECRKFAIAGVSRNKHKFGNAIFRELRKKNYDVVPVNPAIDDFEGEKCYKSVSDLPPGIEALIVTTKPGTSLSIIREAHDRGIKNIFLQQGAQDQEAITFAENNGMNIVYKKCILMFMNPTGLHKFHASLARFFGFYPN